jgi:hypothetical protein
MSSTSTIGSWRHLNSSFLSRQLQMRNWPRKHLPYVCKPFNIL